MEKDIEIRSQKAFSKLCLLLTIMLQMQYQRTADPSSHSEETVKNK